MILELVEMSAHEYQNRIHRIKIVALFPLPCMNTSSTCVNITDGITFAQILYKNIYANDVGIIQ